MSSVIFVADVKLKCKFVNRSILEVFFNVWFSRIQGHRHILAGSQNMMK